MTILMFLLLLISLPVVAQDTFYSPSGNPEVWAEKPAGYFTVDEWRQLHPAPEPEPVSLDTAKDMKKYEIDANTNRIRDRDGLVYAGKHFAVNDSAMMKWIGLMSAKEALPYPVSILTMTDEIFVLANQDELLRFVSAALLYETDPESPLTTGRALRQRVDAAQTVEDVAAIIDERD